MGDQVPAGLALEGRDLLGQVTARDPSIGPVRLFEHALVRAAYDRGVLVEDAAWHWARPECAPPGVITGFGSTDESAIRRGVATLGELVDHALRRAPDPVPPGSPDPE